MNERTEFDSPIFKILANNDTGQAVGHQGGIVIPKELDQYFPNLASKIDFSNPTVDETITISLYVGNDPKGIVQSRYQYQTWGQTRSPERRLTTNLTAIRKIAHANDVLLIERHLINSKFYRLQLIQPSDPKFELVKSKIGNRRWGPLDKSDAPATEQAVLEALGEQEDHESKPFQMFDNMAILIETKVSKIARSRAFQQSVTRLYQCRCAVCNQGFVTPNSLSEIEAAHIVPRGMKGSDDARNGLALCRSHHWAFDHGLFGVAPTGLIFVPQKILKLAQNQSLSIFASKKLVEPSKSSLSPSPVALKWHIDNIVKQHF